MPHRLLVVDDEPTLRKALRMSLSGSAFEVEEASSGEAALALLQHQTFNAVLLDINMPGLSGIEVCRRIRAAGWRVGIVMVTVRDSEDDKVRALNAGADDFVTKPYRLRELVARLEAVLRRINREDLPAEVVLCAGPLELNLGLRTVHKEGVEIRLSPKEFDLLAFLMQHQGAPVLHARLLQAVWGAEYGRELEYLRSYIKMLRKKIEADPGHPEYLITEPWVGYRFVVPPGDLPKH